MCGRSGVFPLCDGRHAEHGWACSAVGHEAALLVVGGRHLLSAAERLAHREGAVAAHRSDVRRARRVIALVDASDLGGLHARLGAFGAEQVTVLAVDVPAAAVQAVLPSADVRQVPLSDPLHLWRGVLEALDGAPAPPPALPRGFLSHAVADEALLVPAVDAVRRLGVDLFVCGDSIAPGHRWLDTILEALDAAERFVWIGSEASARSTFCAFEIGWARSRGMPVRAITLDGTLPPPFFADVQAIDLVRRRAARPWLSEGEALVEALLDSLA